MIEKETTNCRSVEGNEDMVRQLFVEVAADPALTDELDRTPDSTRNETTRVRTAFRVRGSDKIYCTSSRVRGVSHFTECADHQRTRLVVGTNKDLPLLRVRGEGQHNTIREVTLDDDRHEYRTAHVRGMTSTPRCAM